jgi:hypothetical protein
MGKDQIAINLLSSKQKKLADQFLEWALAVGRLLVILTEIVALSAFLYRFSIDRQLIDLHDEIKKNQNIVLYFKQGENSFRHMQEKLAIAKRETNSSKNLLNHVSLLIQLANRNQVTFTTLTVNDTKVAMTVQANTISALSTFFTDLKSDPSITAINVEKVESKADTAKYILGISAQIKTDKKRL